ncbi:MAG: type II toxin-antitoxin system VapC family toxin [Elusimicrobia bacterium]|nr:type II toxin-antitoxin system VapC family toxin [Elusimicrobiota bacterium]
MPELLLDSDVIIEALRGSPDTLAELAEVEAAGWLISYTPIAKAEIYHGLRRGEEKATEGFFAACRCLTITGDVGEKAGRYLAAYHAGHGTEIADALVAASAFVHKAALFTLNRRHYPMTDIAFHKRRSVP